MNDNVITFDPVHAYLSMVVSYYQHDISVASYIMYVPQLPHTKLYYTCPFHNVMTRQSLVWIDILCSINGFLLASTVSCHFCLATILFH